MRHDPCDVGRSVGDGPGHVKPTFESETQAAYDPATLAINTETVAYDFDSNGTADFTRVIDRSRDGLGRDSGWQLKEGSTIENQAAYIYGATDGRLASVGNGVETFTYGYTANSSLLATVTGPAHVVANTYDTTRNVLLTKENEVGSTLISGYSYTVNVIGQRTNVAKSGTAFSSARDIAWGYDALGQVISADSTIPGLDRGYRYDMIGNRLKSSDGTTDPDDPSATAYTANALNQYSAINSLTTSHDDDGNMTSGPLPANLSANSTLVWDGENRLIQAQVSGGNTVTYRYDAQSRRIAVWSAGLQPASSPPSTVYVYDGWNPIAEYGVSYALTKTNTWGLDLSGSMQGAGGVGGLLSVTDGSGTYFPAYDGNGNITEYLDGSGTVVAHYEYDPFGKTTVATGSKAEDFAHRFSTKPLDATTGLYYYGYRFYDPVTGRWPSRDPIGEQGGVNLYGFLNNNGIDFVDVLGLCIDGDCKIDLLAFDNVELRFCIQLLGQNNTCITIAEAGVLPDIKKIMEDSIKKFKPGPIDKYLLRKIAEALVKEAVLKSIIKGLPVANHGKLMEAAVAFSVLNISLEVEYTQHYNLCRCENGSYGKWYWFPQNTKVTHMISEMNPGKGRGGAAGRAITSVTIPEIPGQIKTVIDKAVNNGNWDFRKSSKDTIKNEEKCN